MVVNKECEKFNFFKVFSGNETRLNISVLLQHRAVFTKNRNFPHKNEGDITGCLEKVFGVILLLVCLKLVEKLIFIVMYSA
ncbi:hypothetical protein CKQ54_02720 [Rahnella variigena]|jgi:hypothetical protein|uniref:Uncharacterized protein n=1 Tax=Rahnella variigena TaxID=574964 RepID=A0ABX9PT28_9GAMM|nr:hypothetical protein D6D38_24230 [Rahnella variigena]RKF67371.1 hypothetical protein CKQ54_02720 [Rahnella variigena]